MSLISSKSADLQQRETYPGFAGTSLLRILTYAGDISLRNTRGDCWWRLHHHNQLPLSRIVAIQLAKTVAFWSASNANKYQVICCLSPHCKQSDRIAYSHLSQVPLPSQANANL